MIRLFILFFSLLIFNSCKSSPKFPLLEKEYQNDTLVFYVFDKLNNPIELAGAVYLNRKIGSFSSSIGKIVLPVINDDSIKITCLGYRDTVISIQKIKLTNQIFLQINPNVLPDLNIRNYTLLPRLEEAGFFKDVSENFCINQYGSQIAVMIDNTPKKGILNQIQIRHQKTTYESYLRIHIYENDPLTNLPDKDIFDSIIICRIIPKTNKTIIDLSKARINVSNIIFHIGIDFLGKKDFIDGSYLQYNRQAIEPFILLTNNYQEERTSINFMSKKWSRYFVVNDPKGIKQITNAIVSCKIQQIK